MGSTTVNFTGTTNANLYNYSSGCQFSAVTINKGTGNGLYINAASTATLNFGGTVTITSGSLIGQANITTVFSENIVNNGLFSFNNGTVSLEKTAGTQSVATGSGNWFYNLTVNTAGTVTFSGFTQVKKDLLIQAGVLDPLNNPIEIWGNWTNNVGTAGFSEGTGKVTFAGGSGHQYCSDETFNILEIAKSTGSLRANGTTVTCARYDWTNGSIDVLGSGTFTANDLVDNGLYGGFYVNTGSTINLYQDAGQFIDLGAVVNFNGGGTINIYGGSSPSVWGFNANATLTMNGGTLDFKDQGFNVLSTAPYTVGVSMTGGAIRTTGNILINSVAFDPAGGTVEMYGAGNHTLAVTNGWLYDFICNKTSGYGVTLDASLNLSGNFTVDNGIVTADNKLVTVGGNLDINDNGILHLGAGSQLRMAPGMALNINSGGRLEAYGTLADNVNITHSAGYYYLSVNPGAMISSRHTTFQYSFNVIVSMNALIDPANAFYHCTFTNFSTASFLSIQNDQTVSLHEVNFPTAPPVNNVIKGNSAGRITFVDPTGAFAGPTWEYDPYNRIDWRSSIVGSYWTGEASTDWFEPANWDDYTVPDATSDVTIPSSAINEPAINSGAAYCNHITILNGGELTVGAGDLHVSGNMDIQGKLIENHANADIFITGDILWKSGSTADITAGEIRMTGDWEFRDGANARLAAGTVLFTAGVSQYIRSYEANCAFYNLTAIKSGGTLYYSNVSTDTLKIDGALNVANSTSLFSANSSFPLRLKGQLYNSGHITGLAGTFIFDGTTHNIDLNTGDYFNNMLVSSTGITSMADSLRVRGNLSIESGSLVTNNFPILIRGHWSNTVGPAGFDEGTGKTVFEGATASYILTDETFYLVEVNKSYSGFDGILINDSLTVLNNLDILDGTFRMHAGSILHIGNRLNIAEGAGLNAMESDVKIYCGDDWTDANATATVLEGFNGGLYSVVYFLNTTGIQTVQTRCGFNDVVVKGFGTYVRPNLYGMNCHSLTILSGTFRLTGYKVTAGLDVTVQNGTLRMDLAADSLLVGRDMIWEAGSNDLVSSGKILVEGDWTFQNGTNASLGTGNTVIFNQAIYSMIRCDDSDASFGNLVIGKPAGPSADAFIHASSTDSMRVAGTMTVNAGNQFHLQNRRLIADGTLDIQSSGEMDMIAGGYLLNNAADFILNGKLNVNTGIALFRGTFEEAVTGELNIAGGTFKSEPPTAGGSSYIRGLLTISSGTFDMVRRGINIASTATTIISGGTILTGISFNAHFAATFQPTGGTLKLYGAETSSMPLMCSAGNWVYNVEFNGWCNLSSDVIIRGDLLINADASLSSLGFDIQIYGDWTNNTPWGFTPEGNIVDFTGPDDAEITTQEAFSSLVVSKTNANATALQLGSNKNLIVYNDLQINDGCFQPKAGAYVTVYNDLIIANGAGLNMSATPEVHLSLYGDWYNDNVTPDGTAVGFIRGTGSYITFAGTGDSYLSTQGAQENFCNLFIVKSGGASFRSNDNVWCERDLDIYEGKWEDNVTGLQHRVNGDFLVAESGAIMNAAARNSFEFYGGPSTIRYESTTGCLHNVIINKGMYYANLESDLNCLFGGNLTIESGRLSTIGYRIWIEGDLAVNDEGWMKILDGSELVMTDGNSVEVNSGGRLDLYGMTLRADTPDARYAFNINSGGTFDAGSSTIRHTGINGVYLKAGSILLSDDYHPGLSGCTFSDGAAGGTLLRLDNDQDLEIRNAVFPDNTWYGFSNVKKTVNSGQVFFVRFSGAYSGEPYDNDVYGLVTWVPPMTVTATATPATICEGSGSQLNVLISGGMPPYYCVWTPSGSLSDPFDAAPIATPAVTTTYQVTVYGAFEINATAEVTVTVNPVLPASVTIAVSANPSPPGDYVNFTATPVNGGSSPSYQWKVNGMLAGTGHPTFACVPSDRDDVTCVMTSNYPCASGSPATSNTITMIVVPVNTSIAGNVPSPLNLCFDASNTVTVAGEGATFSVQPGAAVDLIAGQKIRILDGARVFSGGYLHGWITPTHQYCGSLPPSMVAAAIMSTEEGQHEFTVTYPENDLQMVIYPNPASGSFKISLKGISLAEESMVKIFNMQGRCVLERTILDINSWAFDIVDWPAGCYFIRLQSGSDHRTGKLIVTK